MSHDVQHSVTDYRRHCGKQEWPTVLFYSAVSWRYQVQCQRRQTTMTFHSSYSTTTAFQTACRTVVRYYATTLQSCKPPAVRLAFSSFCISRLQKFLQSPNSTEIKSAWCFVSTSLYVFLAQCWRQNFIAFAFSSNKNQMSLLIYRRESLISNYN
jgi:hypothetical protein